MKGGREGGSFGILEPSNISIPRKFIFITREYNLSFSSKNKSMENITGGLRVCEMLQPSKFHEWECVTSGILKIVHPELDTSFQTKISVNLKRGKSQLFLISE